MSCRDGIFLVFYFAYFLRLLISNAAKNHPYVIQLNYIGQIWVVDPPRAHPGRGGCWGRQFPRVSILPDDIDGRERQGKPRGAA